MPEEVLNEEDLELNAEKLMKEATDEALKKRLEQLETLKKAGLITKEEYDQKRQEILAQL